MGSLWNPIARMAEVDDNQLTIVHGEGAYVEDAGGRRYLDAAAALWFRNVGYGRAEIATAMARQVEQLHTFHLFGGFANEPVLRLAERLAELAPFPGGKVFFTTGGSDAIDSAAKLARRYFHETGQPDRTVLITRTGAYHGMNGCGTSLAGIDANRTGYGSLLPDVVVVEWDSIPALETAVDDIGPDRVAGMFAEPVMGAGGVRFAPHGYLEKAASIVRTAGGLLIADEVITGFGRLGAWFGSIRLGLQPDIITFAKGVTSGYAPMGGLIASSRLAEPFWHEERNLIWRHGYTYSGHATAAAAANKNLDIIVQEDLLARGLVIEGALEGFGALASHDLVSEVRLGTGALTGVVISPKALVDDPGVGMRITAAAMERGVLLRPLEGGAIQVVAPPLVTTSTEVDHIGAVLAESLDEAA